MGKLKACLWKVVAGAFMGVCFYAHAGIFLDSTRLVITQQEKEASLRVNNSENERAYLITTRLSTDYQMKIPAGQLLVSPLVFRLNPVSSNMVRVRVPDVSTLPPGKESVFFLKVSGYPGSPSPMRVQEPASKNTSGAVSAGVGFILKVFYRPSGLVSPDKTVWQQLVFSRVPGGVQVSNPTPYYIPLSSLQIDGSRVAMTRNVTDLLTPFGKQFYGTGSTMKKQAEFGVYDDFGGVNTLSLPVH